MAMLTANEILSCDDKETIKLSVPQWGGDVIVSELTAFDRDEFDVVTQKLKAQNKPTNPTTRMVALCLVDERGKRLFSDDKIDQLSTRSGEAMQIVAKAVLEINKLTQKDIEEAAKNS